MYRTVLSFAHTQIVEMLAYIQPFGILPPIADIFGRGFRYRYPHLGLPPWPTGGQPLTSCRHTLTTGLHQVITHGVVVLATSCSAMANS